MYIAIKFNNKERAERKVEELVQMLNSLRDAARSNLFIIEELGKGYEFAKLCEHFPILRSIYNEECNDDYILEEEDIMHPIHDVETSDFWVHKDGIVSGDIEMRFSYAETMENIAYFLSAQHTSIIDMPTSDLESGFYIDSCVNSIRADNNYNNHEQTEKRMRNLQAENIALRKEIYELKNKLEVADYIATQTDKEKKEGDIA